jgi:hypothetical protein
VGEASIEKRSSPKETAARFLQVYHSVKAGGNKKKNVTTVEAHVPVPDENLVSSPEKTDALQKNKGKRSSPQPIRGEGKTDLVKPNTENKGLDITSEQPEDHHDNSPAKKPRLGRPGN